MDEGHCGLPTEELIPLSEKLLEVPQELIRTALDLELREGTVIADRVGETPCWVVCIGPSAPSRSG
jgi:exodeoxyribonuclease V alpha subunit